MKEGKEKTARSTRIHRGRSRANGGWYRDSISYSTVDRRHVVTSIRARLRLFCIHARGRAYIYTHTCTYIHIYTHMYTHTHTHIRPYSYIQTHKRTYRHPPGMLTLRLFYWQFQKLRPRRVNRLFSSPCAIVHSETQSANFSLSFFLALVLALNLALLSPFLSHSLSRVSFSILAAFYSISPSFRTRSIFRSR